MHEPSDQYAQAKDIVTQYSEQLCAQSFSEQQRIDYKQICDQAPNSHYQTPLSQIQFLCFLIKTSQAKSVLEIGTYRGFTTMCFANTVGSRGRVSTLEHNVTSSRKSVELWKRYNIENIDLYTGLALDTMHMFAEQNKTFDFIYIDADKDNYVNYYESALQLAHRGSIIVLDNMLLNGTVAVETRPHTRAHLLHDLNCSIFASAVTVSFVPGWDGLVLVYID